ncbi:MAG: hypothetical protein QNJ98_19755 [Planctomycetota bacterium]|nr:hypothetical protein [Planctomycetota bacterium]
MGRITDLFASRSLEAALKRARQRLAAGDFDNALRAVDAGLEKFPEAEALREIQLTIRRVQARSGMQDLKRRIAESKNALAFEELIKLYYEVDMLEEARRTARAYHEAHPDKDSPHLLLGEMYLQTFFEDLQARDAHMAHDHLLRAARLNQSAVKPRLLLAELYYCVGAAKALHVVGRALERINSEDDAILPVLEAIAAVGDPNATDSVDGLFAKVEVDGKLSREPTAWPLRNRRNRDAQLREERTMTLVQRMVRDSIADEIVVLRRNGTPLVHAQLEAQESDSAEPTEAPSGGKRRRRVSLHTEMVDEASGLVGVVRTVARTISQQAREFDLGAFKRCAIEGPFGHVVVGRVSNVITGVHRASRSGESTRLWERVAVKLDGATHGGSSA